MTKRAIETAEIGEQEMNALAARMLGHYLSGSFLPAYMPEEPRGLAAMAGANRVTPDLLWILSKVYGVNKWDYEKFKEHIAEGALPAWKGESTVKEEPDTLTIQSARCPLLLEVEADPRVCAMCQIVHESIVKDMARRQIVDVRFTKIHRDGESCELVIRRTTGNV
ncbi:MAG: hypothetical protein HY556_04015 [Euryarchaeota archaeon]|nr:hypothetical protein [Euryarchaeota archaeon]